MFGSINVTKRGRKLNVLSLNLVDLVWVAQVKGLPMLTKHVVMNYLSIITSRNTVVLIAVNLSITRFHQKVLINIRITLIGSRCSLLKISLIKEMSMND